MVSEATVMVQGHPHAENLFTHASSLTSYSNNSIAAIIAASLIEKDETTKYVGPGFNLTFHYLFSTELTSWPQQILNVAESIDGKIDYRKAVESGNYVYLEAERTVIFADVEQIQASIAQDAASIGEHDLFYRNQRDEIVQKTVNLIIKSCALAGTFLTEKSLNQLSTFVNKTYKENQARYRSHKHS